MCYICNAYAIHLNNLDSRTLSTKLVDVIAEDVSTSEVISSEGILALTLKSVQNFLIQFSKSSEYLPQMQLVYGNSFQIEDALDLASAWQQRDFSSLPKIEFRSASGLNQANGAYDAKTATIYLSSDFFDLYQNHVPTLAGVILEEFGHHLDTILNGNADSAGDEGAILSALLQGEILSESALKSLQEENDHSIITLNAQTTQVEKSNDDGQISFLEVTESAGDFTAGRSYGAGAWTDFNEDGLPDLWVNNHFGVNENSSTRNLYLNNGDGTFTDAVLDVFSDPQSLLGDFHGTAWADFDNDGDQDLIQVVGGEGNTTVLGEENLPPDSGPNRLFVNEGGILIEQSREFGLAYDSAKAQMPIWFDFDNDGQLDLFHGATQRADGLTPATVFRQANSGFVDEGSTLLPRGIQNQDIKFGALADLSQSSQLSLIFPGFVAAIIDTTAEPFTDITAAYGAGNLLKGAKDIAVADYNGDLLMDIYLTRNGEDRLLINTGQGLVDWSQNSGINNVSNDGGGGCCFRGLGQRYGCRYLCCKILRWCHQST